jgi:hypothetical protein
MPGAAGGSCSDLALYEAPSELAGRYVCGCGKKYGKQEGGEQETPVIAGEPDDLTPVMGWKGLGEVPGDGGKQVNKQESYFSHDAEG